MDRSLNVLVVEDSEEDALLLIRELRRGGYAAIHRRVETAGAMSEALDERSWDVVISDYGMPEFDGRRALSMVRDRGLDIPFIIVSGTIGEDTAVDAMKAGANDYILKSNRKRLVPVIERELREADMRAERRRMENQLTLSDRLASIGTLAAGVAHEINNPLATIMMNLEFVVSELLDWSQKSSPSSADRALLRSINQPLHDARLSAERVRLIVRDLKMLSKPDGESKNPIDLNNVIESTVRMSAHEVRGHANVVTDFRDAPQVVGSEARVGQVVLNLLLNAAQAIPAGKPDENEIRVRTLQDGNHAVIEVSDTGVGIPEDVMHRIFDPFFTTKPVGVGTGLGLSITHRIVTNLGGDMSVRSAPGRGTTFRVVLPLATARPAGTAESRDSAIVPRRGRILVIDDEKMLLGAIVRMLEMHHVTTAESADAAEALLKANERFDVILCDLMMPGRTGMDLYRELCTTAPDVASLFVFTTGGAFTPEARAFLASAGVAHIEKPFAIDALRRLVGERIAARFVNEQRARRA